MANETLSANIAGLVDDIQAESLMKLQDTAGILDAVRWIDTEGESGKTVDFPIYGTVASSDVNEVPEGTDYSTNKQVTNAATTATVAEHVVMANISDLSVMSARNDIVDDISTLFASAMKAKLEDDIVGLFGSFSQTVAGAGTTMTVDHWYDAIRQIKAGNGDTTALTAVISPKQYYGAKGLRPLLSTTTATGTLSEDFKKKGFVDMFAGMPVLVSNEINEDVGSGGDAAGAIFHKGAIGLHTKGLMNVEIERNASARAFELVAVGRWKEVELVDEWAVYMLSDVS
tara:strand:- start:1277 stop:2134 length:858 start_codon:yes stop_codon:yes gene_type:complete